MGAKGGTNSSPGPTLSFLREGREPADETLSDLRRAAGAVGPRKRQGGRGKRRRERPELQKKRAVHTPPHGDRTSTEKIGWGREINLAHLGVRRERGRRGQPRPQRRKAAAARRAAVQLRAATARAWRAALPAGLEMTAASTNTTLWTQKWSFSPLFSACPQNLRMCQGEREREREVEWWVRFFLGNAVPLPRWSLSVPLLGCLRGAALLRLSTKPWILEGFCPAAALQQPAAVSARTHNRAVDLLFLFFAPKAEMLWREGLFSSCAAATRRGRGGVAVLCRPASSENLRWLHLSK